MTDWQDALKALQDAGLPEGPEENENSMEESVANPADAKNAVQRTPVHIVMERKGRGGKTVTIVEGFECDDATLRDVAARLKQTLGTGGSARGGEILIQGDVRPRVRELLTRWGYRVK